MYVHMLCYKRYLDEDLEILLIIWKAKKACKQYSKGQLLWDG